MIPVIASRLLQEGYTPAAVAGVLGNVMKESGGNPTAVGDNGQSFGLFQHHKERGVAMKQFAKQLGKSATDPMAQTEFAIHELKTQYPKLDAILRAETDPSRAAIAFGKMFERPNEKYADWQQRAKYAQDFHTTLQGGSGTDKLAEIQRKSSLQPMTIGDLGMNDAKVRQAYKEGYKNGKVPQEAETLLDELIIKAASSKQFLIPGLDEDLSKELLSTYADRPDDIKAAIRKAVATADVPASGKDYVNRAIMSGMGTSPEVTSRIATTPTEANVNPLYATQSELGQDTANVSPADRAAQQQQIKAQMQEAQANVPTGVGLAMDVAGAVPWAMAPGGVFAQAGYGAAQGIAATNDTSASGLIKAGLLGAGMSLGMQGLFGAGTYIGRGIANKLSGKSKAEREAADMAGSMLKVQGTNIEDVQQKFADRPDIPLFAQDAVGAEWKLKDVPDAEYRAAKYITRQLMGNVDAKVQGVIAPNVDSLILGGNIRYQNMLKEVTGVDGNIRGSMYLDKLKQDSADAANVYLNKIDAATPSIAKATYQKELVPLLKQSAKLKEIYEEVRKTASFSELPKDSTRLWLEVRKQYSLLNEGYGSAAGTTMYKGMYTEDVKRLSDALKRGTTLPLDPSNPKAGTYSTIDEYYQNVKDPNDIKRAFEKGQDFKTFQDADAIRTYLGEHNSNPEQQAFMLGVVENFQKKLKTKNYEVAHSFTNAETNERLRAAFGSEEKTKKFIDWIAEQTSITNAVNKVAPNRAGTVEATPVGVLSRFARDPVFTSAAFRGSMLFAGARALGEAMQVLTGEATASKEGKALLAAYLTSTDPKVQKAAVANILDSYRNEYYREAIKKYGSRVATATANR